MAEETTKDTTKTAGSAAPSETTPAPAPVKTEKDDDKKKDEDTAGASEEPQAFFEPVVKLDEVEVVSGEEDEEVLFKMRAKLFAFTESLLDKGSGNKSWLERGVGEVRFLKHKEFGKIRLLMRQEKTLKIICNHVVESRAELTPNMSSDKAWVWSCYDFSNGEVEPMVFAIRFGSPENAKLFKEEHDKAKANNKKYEEGADAEDTAAGDEAADALDKLDVKKEDESAE